MAYVHLYTTEDEEASHIGERNGDMVMDRRLDRPGRELKWFEHHPRRKLVSVLRVILHGFVYIARGFLRILGKAFR